MTLEQTIKAIQARGHLRLTEDERATLQAAPAGHVMAAKLLAADAFNRGDYTQAIDLTPAVVDQQRTVENEQNFVSALARAGQLAEALTRIEDDTTPLPPLLRAARE